MTRGTINYFNRDKGFGFISTDEIPVESIFMHFSALTDQDWKLDIAKGDRVQFNTIRTARGLQATDIRQID